MHSNIFGRSPRSCTGVIYKRVRCFHVEHVQGFVHSDQLERASHCRRARGEQDVIVGISRDGLKLEPASFNFTQYQFESHVIGSTSESIIGNPLMGFRHAFSYGMHFSLANGMFFIHHDLHKKYRLFRNQRTVIVE